MSPRLPQLPRAIALKDPGPQPYTAAGFGVKVYQATEARRAGRQLLNFVTLTNVSQVRRYSH